ncbi:ACR080Cp [Eremothecium gossypii ATCC 10895]|uniref:ACR080Cp n=1 Tax=Eremothecium gossypii (strain ATCC 10895 / CBS 109.51 / FGSC 9923 / NRRL Y-1056) TaxID=284811 RepID=Q75C37_EREGS|nr:ACR080Cp [Eremothecium gossypii ATCC 10895]AAS51306.1 ACR080Cp [Eremothecium gossypii ATCC 10895]AEY95598.1 FACR080Cp [Eremothecium gossypii FDAG1]AGO11335.1 AaceriACR080Cp [[Ashbya] aceris (nom. inval.)]
MNGAYGIPGAGASAPKKQSMFQQFRDSPAYPVVVNLALFGVGVAFVQSSLMDMMAPQL